MSVIVKDMDMPQACMYCPMFNGMGCKATMKMFDELTNVAVRVQGCPLVALPEKHGRLIDADELIKNFHYGKEETETVKVWIAIIRRAINHANTIVERER